MKSGDLDEHVAVCGTRTKQCLVCGKNIMLLDYDSHSGNCGKSSSRPLGNIGNVQRNAPPPVDPKYRVERLGPNPSSKPTNKQTPPAYKPNEEYFDHGLSEEDI